MIFIINYKKELPNGTFYNIPIGEDNESLRTYLYKSQSYLSALNYYTDIVLSILKVENLPNNIDEVYYKTILLLGGKSVFCENNIGLVSSDFTCLRYDYQGLPSQLNLSLSPYINNADTQALDYSKVYQKSDFEIVYCNETKTGFAYDIQRFALLEAMCDIAIHNNLLVNSLSAIIQGKKEQVNDIESIVDILFNQSGIIEIGLPSGAREDDKIEILTPERPYICDKVQALRSDFKNLLLSRLGIKHTPYEKKERLISAEVNSGDECNDLLKNSMLNTIQSGLDRVNKHFNTNIRVYFTLEYLQNKGSELNI